MYHARIQNSGVRIQNSCVRCADGFDFLVFYLSYAGVSGLILGVPSVYSTPMMNKIATISITTDANNVPITT